MENKFKLGLGRFWKFLRAKGVGFALLFIFNMCMFTIFLAIFVIGILGR